MDRVERVVTRALEVWAGILLVAMVAVVTAGVFYRYVLNAALVGWCIVLARKAKSSPGPGEDLRDLLDRR